MKLFWKFISISMPLAISSFALASTTFTYKGQLQNTSGEPNKGTVKFKFQIFDPSGKCLLYEEQTPDIDLSFTEGRFSVQVGSNTRTDQTGITWPGVFDNGSAKNVTCTDGNTSYTPAQTDNRRMRVTVIEGSNLDVLSPDEVISGTPFATTAQTLQGKTPESFVQTSSIVTQNSIDQLASGQSSLYLRADGQVAQALNMNNQKITGVAAPLAASDVTNKGYVDTKLGGKDLDSAALTLATADAGKSLTWDGSKWVTALLTDNSVLAHARSIPPTCSSSQKLDWISVTNTWSCTNIAASGGGGASGGAIENISAVADVVLTSASPQNQYFNVTGGGSIKLPDATTMQLGGPAFTILNGSSGISLPVIDSSGKVLGAVANGMMGGNGTARLYLFDNSTPSGRWQLADSNLLPSGVHRSHSLATPASGTNSVSLTSATEVSPDTWIISYLDGSPTYNRMIMGVKIDKVANTATIGTPIQLYSGGTNNHFDLIKTADGSFAMSYSADGSDHKYRTGSINNSSLTINLNTEVPGAGWSVNGTKAVLLNSNHLLTFNNSGSLTLNSFTTSSITPIVSINMPGSFSKPYVIDGTKFAIAQSATSTSVWVKVYDSTTLAELGASEIFADAASDSGRGLWLKMPNGETIFVAKKQSWSALYFYNISFATANPSALGSTTGNGMNSDGFNLEPYIDNGVQKIVYYGNGLSYRINLTISSGIPTLSSPVASWDSNCARLTSSYYETTPPGIRISDSKAVCFESQTNSINVNFKMGR